MLRIDEDLAGLDVRVEDGVARVLLDHPPLNILSRAVLASFRQALGSLAARSDLRVLLLEAAGKHFSAGASVEEHLPPAFAALIEEFDATVLALHDFPLPVVAAVHGRCLGGAFELVQAADIVIAGEGAVFGQPEIHLGVFPPVACALLARRTNPAFAAYCVFTGEPVGAAEAAAAGFVSRIVPDLQLAEAAEDLAREIARHSAATLRSCKRALRSASALPLPAALAAAGHIYNRELMATHDAVEGLYAFAEKRSPEWSHR
jgi:cyclohexa-1,5-dienecarbonyl-CoA hydratase